MMATKQTVYVSAFERNLIYVDGGERTEISVYGSAPPSSPLPAGRCHTLTPSWPPQVGAVLLNKLQG